MNRVRLLALSAAATAIALAGCATVEEGIAEKTNTTYNATLTGAQEPGGGEALAMGLCAFAILMLAEVALARLLTRQSPGEWAASLLTPEGALGLGGQVLFGLMPWWVIRQKR